MEVGVVIQKADDDAVDFLGQGFVGLGPHKQCVAVAGAIDEGWDFGHSVNVSVPEEERESILNKQGENSKPNQP